MKKTITVLYSQIPTVAKATGVSEAHAKQGIITYAASLGYAVEFAEHADVEEGGFFMAHTTQDARDRHASRCSLCGVPVYHMDLPPPNFVMVCMECGHRAAAAEAAAKESKHESGA